MVRLKGERACALITGEERIRPETARYFACTVEAMPQAFEPGAPFDFIAIDEIQLATDPDRGHVFTDRILHARGRHETMLLGADTMRPALQALDLDIDAERRERFSHLGYAGPVKITKLPKRSAVVAFSAEEVYAIAELLKRQRGGCAVIMGALSPRTRNAQVALYQSGEVDYIVATDAIGMGLNLDVQHIAFASRGKFDGRRRRPLRADEAAQIAGRAGRFRDDGTFGETADCERFDEEMIERIVDHRFEPTDTLNWRNSSLDWTSIDALLASLRRPPPDVILRRAPEALDETTLAALGEDGAIRAPVRSPAHVRRLWDLCTLPDFRKHGPDAHLKLVGSFLEKLAEPDARLKDEWMYEHVERLNNAEGGIDILQQRLAHIRTWTYAANRSDWVENAGTWRGRAREIEDRLSDALHERLMQRFVDRRTSALLKTLNAEEDVAAEVDAEGRVMVGGHDIGRLDGLAFLPDATGQTLEGRALRNAAIKALRPVIERKLAAIIEAPDEALSLDHGEARIEMDGAPVARLVAGPDWLTPNVELMGAPDAQPALREAARERVARWLGERCGEILKPLFDLRTALKEADLSGAVRGAAYQLLESGAALDRREGGRNGDGPGAGDRAALHAIGVRAGRTAIWLPGLLKPAGAQMAITLRGVHSGLATMKTPSSASFPLAGATWPDAMLRAAGYIRLGPRAVRADMAERLSWALGRTRRGSETSAFTAPPELAALIGCPIADFPDVLRALGLKPAERDPATNAVTRWRFASQRSAQRRNERQRDVATASGPFAALAALTTPAAKPAPAHRKRRNRQRRPQPKTATS